jgi:hypothetical protein
MSADIADVGYYCRRCLLLSLSLLSLMPLLLVRCLHSEIDAAGQANALETPVLLSSDGIVADVELDQRPVVAQANSERLDKLHIAPLPRFTTGDIKLFDNSIDCNCVTQGLASLCPPESVLGQI